MDFNQTEACPTHIYNGLSVKIKASTLPLHTSIHIGHVSLSNIVFIVQGWVAFFQNRSEPGFYLCGANYKVKLTFHFCM